MTLTELKSLSAEATPGPWRGAGTSAVYGPGAGNVVASLSSDAILPPNQLQYVGDSQIELQHANAALIVAAVNLVRALTDEGALETAGRAVKTEERPIVSFTRRQAGEDEVMTLTELKSLSAEARSLSLTQLPLDLQPALAKCADAIDLLTDQRDRMYTAILWALGEGDSDFGENIPAQAPRYWWRDELRRRAALSALLAGGKGG